MRVLRLSKNIPCLDTCVSDTAWSPVSRGRTPSRNTFPDAHCTPRASRRRGSQHDYMRGSSTDENHRTPPVHIGHTLPFDIHAGYSTYQLPFGRDSQKHRMCARHIAVLRTWHASSPQRCICGLDRGAPPNSSPSRSRPERTRTHASCNRARRS